jgi:hypothetical protein
MLVRLIKYIFAPAFFLLVYSCSTERSEMRPGEYIAFVDNAENGFIREKQIGGVKFKLKYQPLDYLVAKQITENKISDKHQLDEYIRSRNGLRYFILELENERAETDLLSEKSRSQEEYLQRVNYYSYEFENDIRLVSEKDTLPCAMYHYENSYGGTPKLKFLIAFKESGNNMSLVINDRIFNNGNVKLELADDAVMPRLNLEIQ